MATIGKVCIYVLFGSCMVMHLWMLIRKQLWSEEETFTSNEGTENWRKAKEAHWGSLSEPALRISLDHHFANINDKASTKPYKFLCDTKEFFVVSEIYHIFSLSLLYYPTIYDSWIVSVMESIDKVSWTAICGVVGPSVSWKHVTKL